MDPKYEAALGSKLQADRARAEGAAVAPGGPSSLGSGSVVVGPSARHGGSSSSPSDPWEVAAAASKDGSGPFVRPPTPGGADGSSRALAQAPAASRGAPACVAEGDDAGQRRGARGHDERARGRR